jgi:hypothetical protein
MCGTADEGNCKVSIVMGQHIVRERVSNIDPVRHAYDLSCALPHPGAIPTSSCAAYTEIVIE